ncbi:MAG: hypothetical protein ABW095_16580 [Candidatus Thiodiazotropha sp.]
MKNYCVTFLHMRRFCHVIEAENEDEAVRKTEEAFFRGELRPDYSIVDHFKAEETQ